METTSQFLQYYTYNVISLLLFFTIGTLAYKLLNIQSQTSYKTTFYRIVIGLLIFTISVAIFRTSGKSVLIFLAIPLLIFFSYLKKQEKTDTTSVDEHTSTKEIIISSLLFCAIFTALFTFIYLKPDNLFSTLPHQDYIFYARLSTYIWTQGCENIYINYLNTDSGLMPYHYFELWLNIGLSKIFGTNPLFQLMLSTYAIILYITWLGIMSIFNYLGRINSYTYVFAGLSFFVSGLFFVFFKEIAFTANTDLFAEYIFSIQKLSVIYLFLCIILFGIIRKDLRLFLCGILFLSFAYTTLLPLLFASATLYILFLYLKNKDSKILLNIVLLVCIALFVLIFFYLLQSKTNVHKETFSKDFNLYAHIRTMINIFGGTLIHLSIIFFFHLIILSVNAKKLLARFAYIFIFLVITLSIGLVEWGILHKMLDSVQLFYIFNISLIILTFSICLYYLMLSSTTTIHKNIYLIIFVILVSSNIKTLVLKKVQPQFSADYVHSVLSEIKNLTPNCVFLYGKEDYTTVFMKNPNFTMPAKFTALLDTRIQPISISVFDTPLDETDPTYITEKKMIEASIFYRYVETQKKKNKFISIEAAQKSFIIEHHIQYLFTSKSVTLNKTLQAMVKKHLKDNISGEQFYLLQY